MSPANGSIGRKVLRDGWLAPLSLNTKILAKDPQSNTEGVRASDKGFLKIRWREYVELLRWTARQRLTELVEKVPDELSQLLSNPGS